MAAWQGSAPAGSATTAPNTSGTRIVGGGAAANNIRPLCGVPRTAEGKVDYKLINEQGTWVEAGSAQIWHPPTSKITLSGSAYLHISFQLLEAEIKEGLRTGSMSDKEIRALVSRVAGGSSIDMQKVRLAADDAVNAALVDIVTNRRMIVWVLDFGSISYRNAPYDLAHNRNIIELTGANRAAAGDAFFNESCEQVSSSNIQTAQDAYFAKKEGLDIYHNFLSTMDGFEDNFRVELARRRLCLQAAGFAKNVAKELRIDFDALEVPSSVRAQLKGELDVKNSNIFWFDVSRDDGYLNSQAEETINRIVESMQRQLGDSYSKEKLKSAISFRDALFSVELTPENYNAIKGNSLLDQDPNGPNSCRVAFTTLREALEAQKVYHALTGKSLFFGSDEHPYETVRESKAKVIEAKLLKESEPDEIKRLNEEKEALAEFYAGMRGKDAAFQSSMSSLSDAWLGLLDQLRPMLGFINPNPEVVDGYSLVSKAVQRYFEMTSLVKGYHFEEPLLEDLGEEASSRLFEVAPGDTFEKNKSRPNQEAINEYAERRRQWRSENLHDVPGYKALRDYYHGRADARGKLVSLLSCQWNGSQLKTIHGHEQGVVELNTAVKLKNNLEVIRNHEEVINNTLVEYSQGKIFTGPGGRDDLVSRLEGCEKEIKEAKKQVHSVLKLCFEDVPDNLNELKPDMVTFVNSTNVSIGLAQLSDPITIKTVIETLRGCTQTINNYISATRGQTSSAAKAQYGGEDLGALLSLASKV